MVVPSHDLALSQKFASTFKMNEVAPCHCQTAFRGMNQYGRYGLATIVVTCLLALIIGLFPGIELKSGFGSDQNLSLEHDVETLERSTDLTSDEVYDLYVGPEAPTRDVKKPPPPGWPPSPHESRKEEAAPLPLDINETFEQNNLEPFKVISFRDHVPKCESHGRIAPTVPPRFTQGNYSGYCTVRFDVTPEGQTYNIEPLKCSCLLYTSPSPRDQRGSRMPSSA